MHMSHFVPVPFIFPGCASTEGVPRAVICQQKGCLRKGGGYNGSCFGQLKSFIKVPLPPPHEDRESDSEQPDTLQAGTVVPVVADDFFGSPEATVAADPKVVPRGQFVFMCCPPFSCTKTGVLTNLCAYKRTEFISFFPNSFL